ncbi:MAG: sulfatase [Bacteroidota bacterium]
MKKFSTHINLLFLIILTVISGLTGCSKKQQAPNILFILSDDHTTQAFGSYGSRLAPLNPTPFLDSLAKNGMVFNNVFCNNSICTPSRASILTGQYPQTNGVLDLHQGLPAEKQYLPQEMKKLGYETAVIGKWHLKHAPEAFDHYEVLPLQGKYHDPVLYSREGKEVQKIRFGKSGIREVKTTTYPGHSSDVITDLSIEWLDKKRDKSKPFLLMHQFKAPHDKFEYAKRYEDYLAGTHIPEPASLYENGNHGSVGTRGEDDALIHDIGSSVSPRNTLRDMGRDLKLNLDPNDPDYRHLVYQEFLKRYLRCVKGVDDNVRRLVAYLKEHDLYENTIIIYTADQGYLLGEHDYIDKRWMYEESMRMPFIVHFPQSFQKGVRVPSIINNTDFAPTLIDIAGGMAPEYMQGNSFKTLLTNGRAPAQWQTTTYYRYWMHMGSKHGNPAHFGIRNERYKLIFFYGKYWKTKDKIKPDGWGRYDFDTPPAWEFYDLKKDPKEMQNEYENPAYQKVINEMKSALRKKRKALNETDGNFPHIQEVVTKHWETSNRKD